MHGSFYWIPVALDLEGIMKIKSQNIQILTHAYVLQHTIQVPVALDLEGIMKVKSDDVSALHVVLFQEVERYNIMLNGVRKQISELRKAVKVGMCVRE